MWSSGQSSWLQIQGPGFDSRRYQIFWEVVGLERDSLSLLNSIEELLERKSRSSGLEKRDYGSRGSVSLTALHPLSAKVGITSLTNGGRSVGIVRSRTQATDILFLLQFKYSGATATN
jgi:hypothetical protein